MTFRNVSHVLFQGSLVIDGFYDFTEKQLELLTRLFKSFSRSALTLVYDSTRPELFALTKHLFEYFRSIGAKIIETEPTGQTGTGIIYSGFYGGTYNKTDKTENVEIHTFQSEVSEAEWIAGTIRELLVTEEYRAKDIMIVVRNKPDFTEPLNLALKSADIPVEDGVVRPLTAHPLVRFMLDALEASIHPDESGIEKVMSSSFIGGNASEDSYLRSADDRAWSCIITETDTPDGYITSLKKMLEWLHVRDNLNEMREPVSCGAGNLPFITNCSISSMSFLVSTVISDP